MKKVLALLLSLVMIFAFTACAPKETPAPSEPGPAEQPANTEPIRIGFFAPVTAPAASADGLSAENSAKLAVKLVNEAGGIDGRTVELVNYDDGLDTTQAVSIAEKLTTKDNVAAVVSGSYSGPTRVAAPIIQNAGKVMVSAYAVHPDVVNAGDFIFSQSFPGKVQGKAGAEFAVKTLGAKKIAIIAVDLDFGSELANTFTAYAEANGAKVVSTDKVAISDNEFTAIITKLKEKVKPDLIYIANYYAHAAEVVKQCKLQGLDVPILGTEGADSWQFLLTAGEYANGVYLTTNMNRDDVSETTQEYITRYREEFDMEPDMVGASAYDAFQVIFEAIRQAGADDPAAMRDAIKGLKDFNTVTGKLIQYTEKGEAVKAVQIQQVAEGKFKSYGEITDLNIITPAE
ncbi:MAG: ABC transporter substrate-binding protein [Clostridiaceae bacterium]|nr:ABC transporter substrate-binding protein [Clostridiaceae bacterium]